MLLAAATLTACAGGGAEFRGAPQAGARRTGVYPTFGHMPKAATTQFTPEETKALTAKLDADKARLKTSRSAGAGPSAAQAKTLRKQAQENIDATLKQIETGQPQQ